MENNTFFVSLREGGVFQRYTCQMSNETMACILFTAIKNPDNYIVIAHPDPVIKSKFICLKVPFSKHPIYAVLFSDGRIFDVHFKGWRPYYTDEDIKSNQEKYKRLKQNPDIKFLEEPELSLQYGYIYNIYSQ